MPTDSIETNEEKRARLLAERAKREAAEAEAADALQLQELELEDRFANELGPRGKAFDMVLTPEGPIVVKLGAPTTHEAFQSSIQKEGKASPAALLTYVRGGLAYPERPEFERIARLRAGVVLRCAEALGNLFSGKVREDAGK